MSLEHAPQRQKRARTRKHPSAVDRICDSISEFAAATGISKPTIYRMMADGRLNYVQVGLRMRKIPRSERVRLGLEGDAA